jgi:hypothetical protein
MFLKHVITFINFHAYQTAIAISVLGAAIVVSMLVPRWKCGGHLILRRSRASETEIEMLIDQACARILGDSFANYARQAEFTRGTPQQRLLFRGSAELMEDHIRNHMPRNTKSSKETADDLASCVPI